MIRPLHSNTHTAKKNNCKYSLSGIVIIVFFTIISLFINTTARAQVIVESFEEGVAATYPSGSATRAQTVNNTDTSSTTSIEITNYTFSSFSTAAASVTIGGNTNKCDWTCTSFSSIEETTTKTSAVTTDGPDSTAILTWFYGGAGSSTTAVSLCANPASGTANGFHSNSKFLAVPQNSLLITPIVTQGISAISFWVAYTGGGPTVTVGLRTTAGGVQNFATYPTNTAAANGVFALNQVVAPSSSYSFTTSTASTTSSFTSSSNGVTGNGASNNGNGSAPNGWKVFQVSYTVPTADQTTAGQIAIMPGNGGTIYIDDIEIFAPLSITLGTITPTCYSTTAQVVELPYTATTGNPSYKISGWSWTAFSNVGVTDLPSFTSGNIPITIPAQVTAGTYTATLTAVNGPASVAYPISITIKPQPVGIYTIPATATSYYPLTSTTLVADSFNVNNGTSHGSMTYTTTDRFGRANSATTLNGTSQYFTTATSYGSDLTTFSESIWFKTSSPVGPLIGTMAQQTSLATGNHDRIIYLGGGGAGGKLVFAYYNVTSGKVDSSMISGSTYNDNTWHMVTVTSAPSGADDIVSIYVDGILQNTETVLTSTYQTYSPTTTYFRIGNSYLSDTPNWPGTGDFFSGSIDDVVISSSAFSASDVYSLYTGLAVTNNGPVCIGGSLSLFDATTATGGSYSWKNPAGSIFSTSQNPAAITPVAVTDLGTYTLGLTGSNGCTLTDTTIVTSSTLTPRIAFVPVSLSGIGFIATIYYPFSNNLLDSVASNDATVKVAATATSDRYGFPNAAYQFNGTTQWSVGPGGVPPPTTFSFGTWFKTTTLNAGVMIGLANNNTTANPGTGDRAILMDAGRVVFEMYGATTTVIDSIHSPLQYDDGNWHYALATYSPTAGVGMHLFVDGNLVASNTAATSNYVGYTAYFRIANSFNPVSGGDTYFNGSLDDISIYNGTDLYVTSPRSITQLYDGAYTSIATDSVCSGSPITLYDTSIAGLTYAWSGPGGYTNATRNPTIPSITAANDGTYTVTATNAHGCSSSGTLEVTSKQATIALSSLAATTSQSQCTPFSAISNITYDVGWTATGASIVWSPVAGPGGVTGSYSGGVYTLSGTPTTVGSYSYTVTTTGGACTAATATGTLTLSSATIALSSAVGTNAQNQCINLNAITPITYNVGGTATGAGIVWSPVAGPGGTVAGSFSGGVYTISGTPATTGSYSYTVTTTGGSCTDATATGTLNLSNATTWTGATSTHWNVGSNWLCGSVPTYNTNVIIPNVTNKPVLDSSVTISSLTLNSGATLGLNTSHYILTINGVSTGPGTISSTSTSALIMGAGSTGNIYFTTGSNTIDSLTVLSTAGVTLSSPLNIISTGLLRVGIGTTGATLNAGSAQLTLISDNSGSAQVAAVPVNAGTQASLSTISGTVNVQCYIHSTNSSVSTARRAWRLLTAPVSNFGLATATTIYNSWQDSGISYLTKPGVGTMITCPPASVTVANGMDAGINSNYSCDTWSTASQALGHVTNTKAATSVISNSTASAANIPYFIFVRGDRDPTTVNTPAVATKNNTTLSATGVLQLGVQVFNSGSTLQGNRGLMLVGNPYASAVNFKYIAADTTAGGYTSGLNNLINRFYFWNSNFAGSQGVGNYECVDDAANTHTYVENVTNTAGVVDTTVGSATLHYNDLQIQSGQAFFVMAKNTGFNTASITFYEAQKTRGTNFIYRPEQSTEQQDVSGAPSATVSGTLALLDGDSAEAPCDGIVAQFKDGYSDSVDYLDAPKFGTFDESFSLTRGSESLCIERRADLTASTNDTLFLTLKQMVQRDYQFKFITHAPNHPGVGARLEDAYTGAHTPLNIDGANKVNFTIDANTPSYAQNRFMIVFGGVNIVPLYTNIAATQQANTVLVQWSVSNDQSMTGYALQRSIDGGVTYTTVYTTTAAHTNGSYNWTDVNPVVGNNYYRVISTDVLNEQSYSPVVYVDIKSLSASGITVYPNPITNNQISIAMNNMPAGEYHYRLYNSIGQEIMSGSYIHAGGNATDIVPISKSVARGAYQLEILSADNTKSVISIVYE